MIKPVGLGSEAGKNLAKLVGYVRVSKEEQAQSGLGLESQRSALLAKGCMPIHGDEGLSGALPPEKRPGLAAALDSLKKGDTLVVLKRDRLARDAFEALLLEREVEERGAKILSLAGEGTDGSDDNPSHRLFRRIVDAFSEYERGMIAWRTKKALAVKRSRSERTGGVPFGFTLAVDRKTLVSDPTEQSVLATIKKLRSEGLGAVRIAWKLNASGAKTKNGRPWKPSTVAGILSRNAS